MLKQLVIENFKSIKKVRIDELSRLNIFIGPNNSGKSSILQSIALLAQSLGKSITYNGKFINLGSFSHTIFTGKTRNKIDIVLQFDLSDEIEDQGRKKAANSLLPVRYKVKISSNGISEQTIECPSYDITYRFYRRAMNGYRDVLEIFRKRRKMWETTPKGTVSNLLAFEIQRLRIEKGIITKKLVMLANLLQGIKHRLQNTYYFSPTRAIKEWAQTLKEVHSFGAKGEDTISMLHHIYSNDPSVFNKISKWIEKLGAGKLISGIKGRNSFIILEDPLLKKRVNIVSCGFGINQLLPIIGQCFYSPKKSIIMVEEPEIHLHPGAIGTLIDMFLETISEDKQILITTHSDRLIFELWARFKLGMLKKEDARLFLVNKSSEGTFVKLIELDNQVNEIRNELKSLYEPRSPLEELLNIAEESGDKKLSEKDFSEM